MTYEEAMEIINADRDATYVVQIDGLYMTLNGHMMSGFLLPTDVLQYFKKW